LRTVSVAVSDIGRKRAVNEDSYAVDDARGIFVVADGLGGHVAGRTASDTAVSHVVSELLEEGDPQLAQLRRAVRRANAAILGRSRAQPELKGMGTTLAALCIGAGRAQIAHVGDSRIYLLRRCVLHRLTLDHSYVTELVFRRRMDPAVARTHPNRHVITRALGVFPPCEPDTSEVLVEADDLFVLCTDGITGPIPDEELCERLVAGAADLRELADSLVDCANERGGDDNSTLVLVRAER